MIGYMFLMFCYLMNVIVCGIMIARDRKLQTSKKTWGAEVFIWLLCLFSFFSLSGLAIGMSGIAVNWLFSLIFSLWVAGVVRSVTIKMEEKELDSTEAVKSGLISVIMMALLTLFVSIYG